MTEYKGEAELLSEVPNLRARMIQEWRESRRSNDPQGTAATRPPLRALAAPFRWLWNALVRWGENTAASRAEREMAAENDRLAEMAHDKAESIARARKLESAVRNRWVA